MLACSHDHFGCPMPASIKRLRGLSSNLAIGFITLQCKCLIIRTTLVTTATKLMYGDCFLFLVIMKMSTDLLLDQQVNYSPQYAAPYILAPREPSGIVEYGQPLTMFSSLILSHSLIHLIHWILYLHLWICLKQVSKRPLITSLPFMVLHVCSPTSDYHFKDGKGTLFHSKEQFLHCQKSLMFNDPLSAAKILAAKTHGECKTLGGKVKHFDFDQWKLQTKNIMKQWLTLKFSQNKPCFQALQETSTTSLLEAEHYDKLWCARLGLTDPHLKNKQL